MQTEPPEPVVCGKKPMRIAFQGASGAYSEMAAQRAWPGVETVPCEHFEDVFASVAGGKTSHGLLPIENSVGGSIHRNYDLLLEHDLPIAAETELQVVHNLIALQGTELSQIRRVCSHPQALAQCEQLDRKSTRLNSSHGYISYAVFCLKKKKKKKTAQNIKRKTHAH